MKEFNFSNANLVSNDGKIIFIDKVMEYEEIKIDSTAIFLKSIENTSNITANYSLIAFKNLIGNDIIVRKDLTCYGDIECNSLNVYGNLKCYGNIKAKNIIIQGCCIIISGYIESGDIKENLIVNESLEINDNLNVNGSIICNEGIIGDGIITCEYIYAHEYLEIQVKSGEIIGRNTELKNNENKISVDNLSNQFAKVNISNINEFLNGIEYRELINGNNHIIKQIQGLIPELDFEEINEETLIIFKKLALLNTEFKKDYLIFKEIYKIQDMSCIQDVVIFLKFINYKKNCSEYLKECSVCNYVFNYFLENQRKNIENMSADNIRTNEDFAKALILLENNRNYLSKDEYISILKKLYMKIGITLKVVSKNLDIDM